MSKLTDGCIADPGLVGGWTKELQAPRSSTAVILAVAPRNCKHKMCIRMTPLFAIDVAVSQLGVKQRNKIVVREFVQPLCDALSFEFWGFY